MLLEMHSHTAEHSPCSSVSAKDLIRQVYAKGLDGIVFTDHHHLWPSEALLSLRSTAEVPQDFLILSGQEVSTDFGDVLVYGADRSFPRNTPLADIRRMFPEAALVWAHPYRNNQMPPDEKLLNEAVDAVEIFNSNHTVRGNTRGLKDWHRLRFIATAGTDTHAVSYAGIYPTLFFHPFKTIEEMAREMKQGRCAPFLSETSHFGASAHVFEVQMGRGDGGEPQERIIIRNPTTEEEWQASSRSFAVMEALAAHGFAEGTFRVPRVLDRDRDSLVAIEQAVQGQCLYDDLLAASPARGSETVRLAARWLARLHNSRLVVTPPDEFLIVELQRMTNYLEKFTRSGNPHTAKFREIVDAVLDEEKEIAARERDSFVQGHGDFHPKNIHIGRDGRAGPGGAYITAIDFDRSMVQPAAFDVGCFLAQFRNQFYEHPEILQWYPDRVFLDAYLDSVGPTRTDFVRQVQIFHARTNLGIASYFVGIGLGQSEKLWRVLVEAEHALVVARQIC